MHMQDLQLAFFYFCIRCFVYSYLDFVLYIVVVSYVYRIVANRFCIVCVKTSVLKLIVSRP